MPEEAIDAKLNGDEASLARWARRCIGGGTVYNISDPYLKGRIAVECLKIFVDIAYCCISEKGNTRPEMGEVEVMLELALELQEKADSNMEDLDPHGECKYGEVSFCIPVSDHSLCMDSHGSTSLGSLDVSYSSEASCNQVLDGSSLIVEQTSDDLGRCQSSSNTSKMDLEPLDSLAELCWESRCTVVEDMKNRMTSDNLACLAMSSKNFVEPLK
ncbi:Uncharacterized protein TCM_018940 [Theobroma cacao]|uniref:Uncharacterized protein n=1 Tax=Theobroma cacao TaxID=3641 RepID=A0A061EFI8_THECC|nr:Uncharacterized protein TCM_018940 [Theobroma cacao]